MTAVCCSQCFDFIARKDTTAAKLWLDACAFCVKFEGIFKLKENRVPHTIKHFRCLEELGFITTADGDDAVKVRVNGYDIMEMAGIPEGMDTFCIDREEHKAQWL